jgi:hypothetical protein
MPGSPGRARTLVVDRRVELKAARVALVPAAETTEWSSHLPMLPVIYHLVGAAARERRARARRKKRLLTTLRCVQLWPILRSLAANADLVSPVFPSPASLFATVRAYM